MEAASFPRQPDTTTARSRAVTSAGRIRRLIAEQYRIGGPLS